MLRSVFSKLMHSYTPRFSKIKRVNPNYTKELSQDNHTEATAKQQLITYLKQEKINNQKIKITQKGHLDFYAYMGILSLPFFATGLSTIGVIMTNPASTLIPLLHTCYCNIGTMTLIGYCGIDMASLAVYNILNPETSQYDSNKLRIGIYGVTILGLVGIFASGIVTGPYINLLFVEGIMLNLIADFSIKQANAKWYQKRKYTILGFYAFMSLIMYIITKDYKENLKIQQPKRIQDVSLKLTDYK